MLIFIFVAGAVVGYAFAVWENNLQQWTMVYSWLQLAADVVRGPSQLAFQQPLHSQASVGAVPISALMWYIFRKKSAAALTN